MGRIEIHIGRVVFDGVGPTDPDAFRDALATGLAGLARQHPVTYPRGEAAELHGAALTAPALVGGDVAQSIWGSIVAGAAGPATGSLARRGPDAGDALRSGPGT